ncbi:MAG: IS110 family transposase [Thiolinea sp.]
MSHIITIDLAKEVFELAVANSHYRIIERQRLSRPDFEVFMRQQSPAVIVMEACGMAHHWGRTFQQAGHQVLLLPAQYVRPYRRRNKTDRADCEALLEAYRCDGLKPVAVKTTGQQELQHLHRLREQWKQTRNARFNFLRAVLREQGIFLPVGNQKALSAANSALESLSLVSLQLLQPVIAELKQLEKDLAAIEAQIASMTRSNPVVQRLRTIPGIGLITSTALVAAIGKADQFTSGRHLASWLGITPRESSSGHRRQLGSITRQGNPYLRTLLIHGARSVVLSCKRQLKAGKPLNALQAWVVQLEKRVGHNKATVALANKLARIIWACWSRETDYSPETATV